jgi:hypothetical protein
MIEGAFSIIDPFNIIDVKPRAQFSPINKINMTLSINEFVNITHCI